LSEDVEKNCNYWKDEGIRIKKKGIRKGGQKENRGDE
jgi:hypothetical protein